MRISDWSSDVCSSDLIGEGVAARLDGEFLRALDLIEHAGERRIRLTEQGLRELVVGGVGRRVGAGARDPLQALIRSEASRVGKECVGQCSSRWSPYH